MELMAKLVGCYGDSLALPMLHMLTGHKSESVCWQAVASISRIDSAAAKSVLERMALGDRAGLRDMALRTLDQFDEAS